jgi:hypothetical protein
MHSAQRHGERGDYREACRYLRAAEAFAGGEGGAGPAAEDARLPAALVEREELRAELDRLRGRVAAMESSKFWRLRRTWFRLTRAFRRPGRE